MTGLTVISWIVGYFLSLNEDQLELLQVGDMGKKLCWVSKRKEGYSCRRHNASNQVDALLL